MLRFDVIHNLRRPIKIIKPLVSVVESIKLQSYIKIKPGRPGLLLNFLCTFSFRPVSTGSLVSGLRGYIKIADLKLH